MLVSDTDGRLIHAQMQFGDCYIIVDSEWAEHIASPATVGGKNTQSIYIRLKEELDTHCEKGKTAAGSSTGTYGTSIPGDEG